MQRQTGGFELLAISRNEQTGKFWFFVGWLIEV